eukprot:scaffold8341_cov23-Prasinocladus_malaysianus.AAC.1
MSSGIIRHYMRTSSYGRSEQDIGLELKPGGSSNSYSYSYEHRVGGYRYGVRHRPPSLDRRIYFGTFSPLSWWTGQNRKNTLQQI